MRKDIETHVGGIHTWLEYFTHFVTGCPLDTMQYVFKRDERGNVDRSVAHAFKCPCGRMWSKLEVLERDVDDAKARAKDRYCEPDKKAP